MIIGVTVPEPPVADIREGVDSCLARSGFDFGVGITIIGFEEDIGVGKDFVIFFSFFAAAFGVFGWETV